MAASPMMQDNFTGGELSKRLRGRIMTELYKKGLDFDENWQIMPQGGLLMRDGTEDQNLAFPGANKIRYVEMRMADEQDYVIVLLDGKLRLYNVDAAAEEIVMQRDIAINGSFDSTYLDSGGARQATDWTKRYIPPSGYTAEPSPSVVAVGSVHLIADTLDYSQQMRQKVTNATGGAKNAKVYVKIKQINGGVVPSGAHVGEVSNVIRVLVETGDGSGMIVRQDYDHVTNGSTDVTFEVSFVAPAGDFYVNVYIAPKYPLSDGVITSSTDATITQVSCALIDATGTEVDTPWSEDQLESVQYAAEPAADRIVFVHGNKPSWTLWYDSLGFWGWQEVAFISKPGEWHDDNWPSTVEIHDGRLYLGATPRQRNRVWASRVGSLFDFTLESTIDGTSIVLPSDALGYKLATKGVIRWMQSRRIVLAGTDLGELSITGSQKVIKPDDIHVEPESEFGSAAIQALAAGNQALYVSPDRRKVRAIAFTSDSEGWDTKDLTFISEHITKGLIKELHHAKHPESLILGLLEDGMFAVCTYDPAEQVLAWWRLRIAGPAVEVLTAAVSSGPSGTFLFLAVRRNAGTIRFERLRLSDSDRPVTLDARVARTVAGDGSITNLTHLNGIPVRVAYADENTMLPDLFTPVGGSINIGADYAGKNVIVGIPVRPKAVLLPKPTLFGKVRSTKVGVILNESALPIVNGKRQWDRKPGTAMDSAEGPYSGKFVCGNLGSDDEGKIIIEQDLPFRTEILAVYDATQASEV